MIGMRIRGNQGLLEVGSPEERYGKRERNEKRGKRREETKWQTHSTKRHPSRSTSCSPSSAFCDRALNPTMACLSEYLTSHVICTFTLYSSPTRIRQERFNPCRWKLSGGIRSDSIVSFAISARRAQTKYDVQRRAKRKLKILTTIISIRKLGCMSKKIYDGYGRISSTIMDVEKKLILVLTFNCVALEIRSRRCQSGSRSSCSGEMKQINTNLANYPVRGGLLSVDAPLTDDSPLRSLQTVACVKIQAGDRPAEDPSTSRSPGH